MLRNMQCGRSSDVAISCGILDVPTTIIYKDGQIRWYFVGIKSEQELKSMIDVLL